MIDIPIFHSSVTEIYSQVFKKIGCAFNRKDIADTFYFLTQTVLATFRISN